MQLFKFHALSVIYVVLNTVWDLIVSVSFMHRTMSQQGGTGLLNCVDHFSQRCQKCYALSCAWYYINLLTHVLLTAYAEHIFWFTTFCGPTKHRMQQLIIVSFIWFFFWVGGWGGIISFVTMQNRKRKGIKRTIIYLIVNNIKTSK